MGGTLDTFVNECSLWKREPANGAKGGGNEKIYLAGVFIFENCRLINTKTLLKPKKHNDTNEIWTLNLCLRTWPNTHLGYTGLLNIMSIWSSGVPTGNGELAKSKLVDRINNFGIRPIVLLQPVAIINGITSIYPQFLQVRNFNNINIINYAKCNK